MEINNKSYKLNKSMKFDTPEVVDVATTQI